MAQSNLRTLRDEAPFRGLDSDLIFEFFAVFSRLSGQVPEALPRHLAVVIDSGIARQVFGPRSCHCEVRNRRFSEYVHMQCRPLRAR